MEHLQTLCIAALAIVLIGLCHAMQRLTNIVAVIDNILTIHDADDPGERPGE